jgi:hypothetical protein
LKRDQFKGNASDIECSDTKAQAVSPDGPAHF